MNPFSGPGSHGGEAKGDSAGGGIDLQIPDSELFPIVENSPDGGRGNLPLDFIQEGEYLAVDDLLEFFEKNPEMGGEWS